MSELRPQGHVSANRFGLNALMSRFNCPFAESLESVHRTICLVQHPNCTKIFQFGQREFLALRKVGFYAHISWHAVRFIWLPDFARCPTLSEILPQVF